MPCYAFPVVLSLILSATAVGAQEEPLLLDDETDRISYSLGHQVGGDFQRQGVELDEAVIARGLREGLAGSAPALSEEQMKELLAALKHRIMEAEREEQRQRLQARREQTEKKRQEGEAFLAANAKKEGVKTLPSGLQYRILKQGQGASPGNSDRVTVHYRGRRLDGNEFGSSYRDGKPQTFRVSEVIPGWKQVLPLMQVGARWELYLPPELGHGRRGPLADETVIYEVELLAIDQGGAAAASEAGAAAADETTSPQE